VRENIGALSEIGPEAEVRAKFVGRLEETESALDDLSRREGEATTAVEKLEAELSARLS